MNIIEKLEIKNFRSFGKPDGVKIYNVKDLNIFSGSNDSGKSNILRALNLFFNGTKVDFYQDFIFSKDFSRVQEERLRAQQKGKSFVEVAILFSPTSIQFNSSVLPKKFWIIKRFYADPSRNSIDIRDEKKKSIVHTVMKNGKKIRRDEDVKKAQTRFLKKINFLYIPAIKDKNFFDFLKEKYQDAIGTSANDLDGTERLTIDEWVERMSSLNITKILDQKIKSESKELFDDFIKKAPEIKEASFNIPYLEIRYSNSLDVETEEKISLGNRGDGVQAKFIPVILDEITKRNSQKPIIIWGFEEPENSLEYKNAQKVADALLSEYSLRNQIFITTHSFNFLSIKDEKVSLYRVYKEGITIKKLDGSEGEYPVSMVLEIPSSSSELQKRLFSIAPEQREILEEELGIYELNEELNRSYKEKEREREEYKVEKEKVRQALSIIRPTRIFICEDSEQRTISLWEKLLLESGVHDVKVMSSEGSTKTNVETGVLHQKKLDPDYNPLVFRQIDRDGLTDEQMSALEEKLFKQFKKSMPNRYDYSFLPVNEIENFAIIQDEGTFNEGFWNKNRRDIEDEFLRTVEEHSKKFSKEFDHTNEKEKWLLFKNDSGGFTSIYQKMRDNADRDKNRLFPGKEICKKKNNFSAIDFLSSLAPGTYPQELKDYLLKVKNFYEES
jgi:predicted ATPase